MSLTSECHVCRTKLKIPDKAVGRMVKCPKCSTILVIPTPLGHATPLENLLPPPMVTQKPPPTVTQKPPTRKLSRPVFFAVVGGGVVAVLLVAVILFLDFKVQNGHFEVRFSFLEQRGVVKQHSIFSSKDTRPAGANRDDSESQARALLTAYLESCRSGESFEKFGAGTRKSVWSSTWNSPRD
jgi:LSD1 subclass zinc finger protein